MILFLLLLIPLALAFYCMWTKSAKNLPLIFAGVFTGTVVCFVKFFFTYAHRLIYYSYAANFVFYIINYSVVPAAVVFLVYFLFTKDTLEFKMNSVFPLLGGFYGIYLPYSVITSAEFFYTSYDLFLRPAVYLAMLMQFAIGMHYMNKNITAKKIPLAVLNGLIAAAYLVVPAAIDAAYVTEVSYVIILLLSLVSFVIPMAYVTFILVTRKFKGINEKSLFSKPAVKEVVEEKTEVESGTAVEASEEKTEPAVEEKTETEAETVVEKTESAEEKTE